MRARTLLVPLLALCLHSCFTTALWTVEFDADEGRERRKNDFWLCLCLTPITVALDCITLPIQVEWFEEDDDEDC